MSIDCRYLWRKKERINVLKMELTRNLDKILLSQLLWIFSLYFLRGVIIFLRVYAFTSNYRSIHIMLNTMLNLLFIICVYLYKNAIFNHTDVFNM
jgi:hypothetical protein